MYKSLVCALILRVEDPIIKLRSNVDAKSHRLGLVL